MRSKAVLLSLALSLALCWGAAQAAEPASAPTREEVRAQLEALRADPNLPGTTKEKTLRFKDSESKRDKETKKDTSSLPAWVRDFARWISAAGRVFVWAVGLLLVAMLLVGVRHWVRARAGAQPVGALKLPSHVRDLDIRPESLPDDIGAAARELWQRGEHRAALSLLYRGTLSRLVHDYAVPIRSASTEGECVALAAKRLAPARSSFVGRLVNAWLLAVYGARLPESGEVLALCAEFDAHLPVVPAVPVVKAVP